MSVLMSSPCFELKENRVTQPVQANDAAPKIEKVPRDGIEPTTLAFSVLCSTDWAILACGDNIACYGYLVNPFYRLFFDVGHCPGGCQRWESEESGHLYRYLCVRKDIYCLFWSLYTIFAVNFLIDGMFFYSCSHLLLCFIVFHGVSWMYELRLIHPIGTLLCDPLQEKWCGGIGLCVWRLCI